MSKGPHLSEDKIAEIVEQIALGKTLKESCAEAKVHYKNVVERIHESKRLTDLYAHVKQEYQRIRVMEMHELARDTSIPVDRARLMIDCIKWEAARVLPKEFGDKLTVDGELKTVMIKDLSGRPAD